MRNLPVHAATADLAGIVCPLCTNAMHRVFGKIENALSSCRSATRWAAGGKILQEPLTFIGHAASVFRGHLHSLRHTFLIGTKRVRMGAG
jgi:hypothetical protein